MGGIEEGREKKNFKKRGQAGSRGGCIKKYGGWNSFTNYGLLSGGRGRVLILGVKNKLKNAWAYFWGFTVFMLRVSENRPKPCLLSLLLVTYIQELLAPLFLSL